MELLVIMAVPHLAAPPQPIAHAARTRRTNALAGLLAFALACAILAPGCGGQPLHYANLELVPDEEVVIDPSGQASANNMVRGPDGTIWINSTTTHPGLFKSSDRGKTWSSVPIRLEDIETPQYVSGFTVTRSGTLWIIHQEPPDRSGDTPYPRDAFVSISRDHGATWTSTRLDFGRFAPRAPQDPYTKVDVAWCHPNFIERPDGTVMFSCSMRYPDWEDYRQPDQSRPGIRDVMVRTTDDGLTWGDPTIVHPHATETAYALNPKQPNHILAATRIQRHALPGEDPEAIKKNLTGVPYPPNIPWCYKNGLILESMDGGRTFEEVSGGLLGFGAYRWSVVWTENDLVLLSSNGGQEIGESTFDDSKVVRISLDGGRTWADGTANGTPKVNQAREFTIIPDDPASHCVSATIEVSPNRFLTLRRFKSGDRRLTGVFWHLENR